ncbi:hypothetical protein EBM89_02020 [Cellulomonas triticagri]|uniref:Uncharacterized protein n=1 Tax=Cellulomonas triticagri TaxID=2483352 RepID=A0A3M2JQT7_9CELL|nr:hypothetical protein EBM89_02020 [Cellulomonas triticagri]
MGYGACAAYAGCAGAGGQAMSSGGTDDVAGQPAGANGEPDVGAGVGVGPGASGPVGVVMRRT